jgi:hypothetical protein
MTGLSDEPGFCNTPRVSRKGAKYAKFTKQTQHSSFEFLCALVPWRELF